MMPHSSTAQANRSRSSVAPSCRPATVNGGQGTPPASRATPRVVLWPPQRRVGHVAFGYLPAGPVGAQRAARGRVEFDRQGVLEAGSLKPEGLPACPGTDLDHLKICHPAPFLAPTEKLRPASPGR